MKRRNAEKKTRRPYQKPRLEQVELIAEEATLTNCKFHGANPGGHAPAMNCLTGVGESCVTFGS